MRWPLGDHSGAPSSVPASRLSPLVSGTRPPDPSVFMMNRRYSLPTRLLAKTMRVLSGDHAGWMSSAALLVRLVARVPLALTLKTSPLPLTWRSKSSHAPSTDHAGWSASSMSLAGLPPLGRAVHRSPPWIHANLPLAPGNVAWLGGMATTRARRP